MKVLRLKHVPENRNQELKEVKKVCRAAEAVIILCGLAVFNPLHYTIKYDLMSIKKYRLMQVLSNMTITVLNECPKQKLTSSSGSARTVIQSFSSTNGPVRTAKQTRSGPQALSFPDGGCHLYFWAPQWIFHRLTGSTGSSSREPHCWWWGARLQGLNVKDPDLTPGTYE